MRASRPHGVRSRAPLRISFAGGGSDLAPYRDTFGGCVVNATIGMYAHCAIEPRRDRNVRFVSHDYWQEEVAAADMPLVPDGVLALHKAVHRRITAQFLGNACLPVTVTTRCDAPAGSGLGSSSTLVVAMIEAYRELLDLPLDADGVARLACQIERVDAGKAGGRQDQYAAAYGGLNFMRFLGERTIVDPMRVRAATLRELEAMLVLYSSGISREVAGIVSEQTENLRNGHLASLCAMHQIRHDAHVVRGALLRDDVEVVAGTLGRGWEAKKRTAAGVTNAEVDRVHELAMAEGALSGKVSGAGGGGFLFFMVPPHRRSHLLRALSREPGTTMTCGFTAVGAQAWRV